MALLKCIIVPRLPKQCYCFSDFTINSILKRLFMLWALNPDVSVEFDHRSNLLEPGNVEGRTVWKTWDYRSSWWILSVLDLRTTTWWTVSFNHPSAFWPVCKPGVLGPGVHDNAGVCLEPQEPLRPHELLWSAHFPSPVSTVGIDGLFTAFGELHHRGSSG